MDSSKIKNLPTTQSAEDINRRKQIFNQIDQNGNGFVSLAEVDGAIRDILQIDELFHSKPVIIRAFNAAKNQVKSKSSHGNDYIERSEFRLFLIYLQQYFEYWKFFESIDVNHDKRISLEEFKSSKPLMEKHGIHIQDLQKEFNKIDKNHGGFILFDEFSDHVISLGLQNHQDHH